MKVELCRLYAKTRADGATVLSGRLGYDGMLRVLPNENYDPDDPKSPSFIAYIEQAPPKGTTPYRGPQLQVPTSARALREHAIEGEIVDQ